MLTRHANRAQIARMTPPESGTAHHFKSMATSNDANLDSSYGKRGRFICFGEAYEHMIDIASPSMTQALNAGK